MVALSAGSVANKIQPQLIDGVAIFGDKLFEGCPHADLGFPSQFIGVFRSSIHHHLFGELSGSHHPINALGELSIQFSVLSRHHGALIGEYDDEILLGDLIEPFGHPQVPPAPVLFVTRETGPRQRFHQRVVQIEQGDLDLLAGGVGDGG